MKQVAPTVTFGKAIRFAPSRDGHPAARIWKVWSEGSEVYALTRSSKGLAKISIHESGQIHLRLESKDKQLMAPPLSLANGLWLHGIELRFLLHSRANRPQEKLKAGAKALLLETPEDRVLVVNILVGAEGCSSDAAPPQEFGGASILWRSLLRNGRPAVLIARILPLDDQNKTALHNIWEEISPTVNFDRKPSGFYMEVMHAHWHPQNGNILLVIPMGTGHARFPGDRVLSGPASAATEAAVTVANPTARISIAAPNGATVATVGIQGTTSAVTLKRDEHLTAHLGIVTLAIQPENLIAGSKFQAQPVRLSCVPSVNGASPREWMYTIVSSFDGETFVSEIRALSAGLRPAKLVGELTGILKTDEIVMTAPPASLRLAASLSMPIARSDLTVRFLLREF